MTALALQLDKPVQVVAGRTETLAWDAKIVGSDGRTQEAMAAGDHIRFKIAATPAGTPVTNGDLNSNTATANGSIVTIVSRGSASALATGTVILVGGDTAALSGTYYFELILIDVSEPAAKQNKIILRGRLTFLDEQQGTLGTP